MLKLKDIYDNNGNIKEQEVINILTRQEMIEDEAMEEGSKKFRRLRKLIGFNTKDIPCKENRKVFHECYNGEQLYAGNRWLYSNYYMLVDGYDLNSAFPYQLLTKKFPLSIELTNEKTELYILHIKVNSYKDKVPEYDHVKYKNLLDKGEFYINNIDFEVLQMWWEVNYEELERAYFKDVDYLSEESKKYVGSLFDDKQKYKATHTEDEYEVYKQAINMACYGMFCRKYKSTDQFRDERITEEEYNKELANEPTVVLGMFIPAYLGLYMSNIFFELYNKDKNCIAYLMSDGIYVKAGTELNYPIGDGIGKFKLECLNKQMSLYRYGFYVLFNDIDKLDVFKQVTGGYQIELSKPLLEAIIAKPAAIGNSDWDNFEIYNLAMENGKLKKFTTCFTTDFPIIE